MVFFFQTCPSFTALYFSIYFEERSFSSRIFACLKTCLASPFVLLAKLRHSRADCKYPRHIERKPIVLIAWIHYRVSLIQDWCLEFHITDVDHKGFAGTSRARLQFFVNNLTSNQSSQCLLRKLRLFSDRKVEYPSRPSSHWGKSIKEVLWQERSRSAKGYEWTRNRRRE
jgi:hypothetical protein